MADESEMIGGIKVSAEVTDAGLDAQLREIEGKLKTAAERWQGLLSVHATATGPTAAGGASTAGGAGQAAPAGPQTALVPPRRQRGISEAEAYSTMRANPARGGTGFSSASVTRAINEALEKEAASGDKFYADATAHLQSQRTQVVEQIGTQAAQAPIPIEVDSTAANKTIDEFSKTTGAIPQIAVAVDDATARQQLTDFLAYVKTTMASAQEAAVVRPQVEAAEVPPIAPPQAPAPVTVPVEVAEAPEVVAPVAPQAVEVPVEVAATPQVAPAEAPQPVEVPVTVAPTPEVAAPATPQAVEIPVTVAETPEVAAPPTPQADRFAATSLADYTASSRTAAAPEVTAPATQRPDRFAATELADVAPTPQAPPAEVPPIPVPQAPESDPINDYMLARQKLLENRTDETVAAFEEAAQRVKDAQDALVEAQEEPVAPPQAPPQQAAPRQRAPQAPPEPFGGEERVRQEADIERMEAERRAQEEANLLRNHPPEETLAARQARGARTPPFEPREDVNARRRQEGQAQLPPPPEEPPKPVVPPKPGTLYSAAPDEGAEAERQAKEARQRETVFNRREQQASSVQRRQDARDMARAEDADRADAARQQRQRDLQELSYENQQREQERPTGSTASAPPLPPDEQARRDRDAANRRNQQAGTPPESPEERSARLARIADFHRRQDEAGRRDREEAAAAAGPAGGGGPQRPGGGRGRGRGTVPPESMEEFIERINARQQEAVQRTLSGITAGGRTGQVAASGISAARFGTRAQQIRATEEQRAGRAIFQEAQKRLRIDPHDIEAAEALENASTRVVAADEKLKNLQGFRATARNIGAIAAGAFVFSHVISAVEPAIKAVVAATGDWIDAQTGFASKSTAVTSALAQQTIAQKGNVDAVIDSTAATAGLSAEAAEFLKTSLKTTVQIKAGAIAQQQASDLFRGALGNQPQQGLTQGFGGLFGGSFLAQQLGGAKGFSETIFGDLANINKGRAPGQNLIEQAGTGLSFLADENFRNTILEAGKKSGQGGALTTGFDLIGAAGAGVGGGARLTNDVLGALNPFGQNFLDVNASARQEKQDTAASTVQEQEAAAKAQKITDEYLDNLNKGIQRGGGRARFEQVGENDPRRQEAAAAAAAAGDLQGAASALKGFIVTVDGATATTEQYKEALQQAAIGISRPDPQTLSRLALDQERQRQIESRASVPALREQFRFERPAVMAAAEREQQFAQNVQIPAQAALANLANPLPAVGTGIVAANADEQERIKDNAKETVALQEKLNDYYEDGKQILLDTYQIPPALINSIQQVGQQITDLQAGIRNNQAAYQVAQYNNQLRIARRSLADIGGLTGRNFGAGQSYLGILEKQNLALSRQAQLLQFSMQQRQINFQVALAGFEAPGVTPEERQANVKEAQIEASYAQKQLDIQRQMFGNQVQIVDISNLRQGVDLAAQISLLLQGRKLTINTAQDEEKILRLQKIQQEQVAQAGTYIEKINKLTGRAFGEIQALETAAGEAMINASDYALSEFGIALDRMTEEFNSRVGGQDLQSQMSSGNISPSAWNIPVAPVVEVALNTDNAQKQLGAINEQQVEIAESVGGYLGEVTTTVTKTSRQVNKLEGEVGDALGRATMAQVDALNTYFTAASQMWSSFFSQVARTAGGGGGNGGEGQAGWGPQHAQGFVGMTTGTTMTGAGVMGEAGQEAYAILRNPKPIMDFGDGGGGDTYIIQFNNPVIREENDIDKLAQKVIALTGRDAALRGLRQVS